MGIGSALSKFAKWLIDAFVFLAVTIVNFGVDVINLAILSVASIFHLLLQVFPTSTVNLDPPASLIAVAAQINWFIPMHAVAGGIALVCASYIAFFTIRPIAKFLHLA